MYAQYIRLYIYQIIHLYTCIQTLIHVNYDSDNNKYMTIHKCA